MKATSLMFKANLKKVTGTMVNIFVQNLTREANDNIHAERNRKRDERDPKRDQCKMKEKVCFHDFDVKPKYVVQFGIYFAFTG